MVDIDYDQGRFEPTQQKHASNLKKGQLSFPWVYWSDDIQHTYFATFVF